MANIAVVGPHPDDQEIGMGGTIALLAEQGHDVLLIDVTDGSPTPRGDRASRLVEAQAALAALQPSPEAAARGGRVRRVLLDLPNRQVQHDLRTRHALAGAYRAHQASIVFIPRAADAHPDHRAVHAAAWDARFDAKLTKTTMPTPPGFDAIGPPIYPRWIFLYDVSHLRGVESPHVIVDITGFERRKQASVAAYRSQFGPFESGPSEPGHAPFPAGDPKAARVSSPIAPRPPDAPPSQLVRPEFPERLLWHAAFWGAQINAAYGEPFWSPEPLALRGLELTLGL